MRRFVKRKIEHVSIQGRISRVIFTSCFITLLVCLLFAMLVILTQRSLLVKNGEEIGGFATEVASEAILNQSISQTNEYIKAKATIMDDYLQNIKDNLVLITDFIEDLYKNRSSFNPVAIPYYSQVPKGTYSPHYYLDYGVSLNSNIRSEMGLLGNAKYLISSMMENHPEIYTVYIYTANGLSVDFDDAAYTKQKIIDDKSILRNRPWFQLAQERGRASITDLYEDDAGRGYCFTFCVPFYSNRGDLLGVIGADISLGAMSSIISSITGNGIDFVLLIGPDGVIAHSLHGEVEIGHELQTYFNEIHGVKSGVLQKIMPDFKIDKTTMKEKYLIWETFTNIDWKLIGFASVDSIVAPAEQIKRNISLYTSRFLTRAYIYADIIEVMNFFLFFLIMGVCLYFASKTAKRISKPIQQLTEDALKIGQGDLDYIIQLETGDEIETLANTINNMVSEIKYITGEKERIGIELDVATQIQVSMLPCIFPPFPHRNEFDLYAYMQSAKEVGGDFYDFYLVDEHKLVIVIADVSGKGIPAALYMVIAKTLIKNTTQYGRSPSEILATVNNILCENNDAGMFVTAFMGILDLQSNMFSYVNAGHNPPLILRNNGHLERLHAKRGLVLGVMHNTPYTQNEIQLEQGDMLYFYTDGVTEAMNKHNVMFSEKRLQDIIHKYHAESLKNIVMSFIKEIEAFAEGVEQTDDITLVVLRIQELN